MSDERLTDAAPSMPGETPTTASDWSPAATGQAVAEGSEINASDDELLRSLDQIVQQAGQGVDPLGAGMPTSEQIEKALSEAPPTVSPQDTGNVDVAMAPVEAAAQAEPPLLSAGGTPEEWTLLSAIGALDGDGVEQLSAWLKTAKHEEQDIFSRRLRIGHALLYSLNQDPPPVGLRQALAHEIGRADGSAERFYPKQSSTWSQRIAEAVGWPQARVFKGVILLCLVVGGLGWGLAWRGYQQTALAVQAAMRSEAARHAAESNRQTIAARLGMLASADLRMTDLRQVREGNESMAHLLWRPFGRRALLWVSGLPAAPSGKEYALWVFSGSRSYAAVRFKAEPLAAEPGAPSSDKNGLFIDVPTLQEGRPRPIQSFALVLQPTGARDPADGERWFSGSTYE